MNQLLLKDKLLKKCSTDRVVFEKKITPLIFDIEEQREDQK